MLNYLNEMSTSDMEHSFSNTYLKVFIEATGEYKAARAVAFNSNAITVILASSGKTIAMALDNFDLTQPDLGMMWWRGCLYYVSRAPSRQWRRGLRSKGLEVYRLEAGGRVSKLHEIGSSMLQYIALYFIEGHRDHDCILSPNFARRGKLLFFRNIPVGTIAGNVITLEFDINISLEGYEICHK